MEIAYITADFGVPVFGFKGASIHVREMVEAFRKQGHGVHIVSPAMHEGKEAAGVSNMGAAVNGKPGTAQRAMFAADGPAAGAISFTEVTSRQFHLDVFSELDTLHAFIGHKTRLKQELRNMFYNMTLFDAAREAFASRDIGLVYERYSLLSFAGGKLARELGVPHVLEVNAPLAYEQEKMRGLELKAFALESESRIYQSADAVIVVSDALRSHVEACGVPAERILVLPNGVDPVRFDAQEAGTRLRAKLAPDAACVIGFVGSLKPWHGTQTLVEAFGKMRHNPEGLRLLIVGDGPMRESLEAQARDLGLADRVIFTGKVPYDDIPAHIAAMDLTVAPYLPSDNFYFSPIKIFEYMAASKPVVAGRLGQVTDMLNEADCGRLFTPGDTDELARVLSELAEDPSSAAEMGANGRAWIGTERTWDRNASRVLELVAAVRSGGAVPVLQS